MTCTVYLHWNVAITTTAAKPHRAPPDCVFALRYLCQGTTFKTFILVVHLVVVTASATAISVAMGSSWETSSANPPIVRVYRRVAVGASLGHQLQHSPSWRHTAMSHGRRSVREQAAIPLQPALTVIINNMFKAVGTFVVQQLLSFISVAYINQYSENDY